VQSVRDKIALEIPVTLALVDLLRPGDVAVDIGANVGDLTIIMSRLVGPRGCVLALEANSQTAQNTSENLRAYNCFNTYVLNRAAAAKSNQQTVIYLGTGPSDSLIQLPWNSTETLPVSTVSVDDLMDCSRLKPRVIKIDVEGYEPEVLKGARRCISSTLPILLLEQSDGDDQCIAFLNELGYHIYCLGSYRRI
jgi:FkbM family methyltransferase